MTLYPQMARHALQPIEEATGREEAAPTVRGLRALIESSEFAMGIVEQLWDKQKAALRNGVWGFEFFQTAEAFIELLLYMKGLASRIDTLTAGKGDEGLDVRAGAQKVVPRVERLLGEATEIRNRLAHAYTPESLAEFFARAEKVVSDPNARWVSEEEMARFMAEGD
jgi:hypothetical protein